MFSHATVLIIGLGSIGQRHLNNVQELGCQNVVAVTSKTDQFRKDEVQTFQTLTDALRATSGCIDLAIIASPTALHLESLDALLTQSSVKIGVIYVEKPVSHSTGGLAKQFVFAHKNRPDCRVVVGCDLRFDPGLIKAKEWLTAGTIGRLVSINAFVGQYLPDWRPKQDYRTGYGAKRHQGGGVLLDLIHEFDYVSWLAGAVRRVACFHHNSGCLDIETEDNANVLLQFVSGASGTIHLDYLQRSMVRRFCTITGTEGTITLDLVAKTVDYVSSSHAGKEIFSYTNEERNDRYKAILQAVMKQCRDDPRVTSFSQGIKVLEMVEAAKISSQKNGEMQTLLKE